MDKVMAGGISEEELKDRDADGKLEPWLEENGEVSATTFLSPSTPVIVTHFLASENQIVRLLISSKFRRLSRG